MKVLLFFIVFAVSVATAATAATTPVSVGYAVNSGTAQYARVSGTATTLAGAGNIITRNAADFATAAQGAKADVALAATSSTAGITSLATSGSTTALAMYSGTMTLVTVGDSITVGLTDTAGHDWPTLALGMPFFKGRTKLYNTAISGNTIAPMTSAYATAVYPHRPIARGGDGAGRVILTILIGTNDYDINGGSMPSGSLAAIDSYITTAQADGFEVWLGTLLPRPSGVAYNTTFGEFNTAIRKDTTPDRIIDFAAAIPDPNDASVMNGVHPTDIGQLLMARVADAVGWSNGRQGAMYGPMALQDNYSVNIKGGTISVPALSATGVGTSTGAAVWLTSNGIQQPHIYFSSGLVGQSWSADPPWCDLGYNSGTGLMTWAFRYSSANHTPTTLDQYGNFTTAGTVSAPTITLNGTNIQTVISQAVASGTGQGSGGVYSFVLAETLQSSSTSFVYSSGSVSLPAGTYSYTSMAKATASGTTSGCQILCSYTTDCVGSLFAFRTVYSLASDGVGVGTPTVDNAYVASGYGLSYVAIGNSTGAHKVVILKGSGTFTLAAPCVWRIGVAQNVTDAANPATLNSARVIFTRLP